MKLVKAKYPYCSKACEMLGIYNDTVVNTICENIAGQMWVDDENNPKVVLGKYKSYHYLNGLPQKVDNLTDILFDECNQPVLIANNNSWVEFLDADVNAKHTERYRLLTPQKFDEETLKGYFEKINNFPQFELRIMNDEDYDAYDPTGWEHNMRGCFKSKEDFLEKSCGVVIVHDGKIISGCSAYTYYSKGVEVQIETLEEYRGMGLGMIVGARYIYECQKRGIVPNWDAAHMQSAKMAQKLGFVFDRRYDAFELEKEG